MGWADDHIAALKRGETVSFRPQGRSIEPRIASGALCTVVACGADEVAVGDIVLCRVGLAQYLHLVKGRRSGVGPQAECLIGNNKGRVNGWTSEVYGRLVRVEA